MACDINELDHLYVQVG